MSGTEWVEPGQGNTLAQLNEKFFSRSSIGQFVSAIMRRYAFRGCLTTNLRLTGAPITDEDWARLESDRFKVGE